MNKRRSLEYTIAVRAPPIESFQRYVAYEAALGALIRARKKRLGIRKLKAAEGTTNRRIHNIYNKATKRFRASEELWLEWIDFATANSNNRRLETIFPNALKLLPTSEQLWQRAATHQHDAMRDPAAARSMLQRGLRINQKSRTLWLGLLRLELVFALRLRMRRVLVGVSSAGMAPEWAAAEAAHASLRRPHDVVDATDTSASSSPSPSEAVEAAASTASSLSSSSAAAAAAASGGDGTRDDSMSTVLSSQEIALRKLLEGSVAEIVLRNASLALPCDAGLVLGGLKALDSISSLADRSVDAARTTPYSGAPACSAGETEAQTAARLATRVCSFPAVQASLLRLVATSCSGSPAVWAGLALRALTPAYAAVEDWARAQAEVARAGGSREVASQQVCGAPARYLDAVLGSPGEARDGTTTAIAAVAAAGVASRGLQQVFAMRQALRRGKREASAGKRRARGDDEPSGCQAAAADESVEELMLHHAVDVVAPALAAGDGGFLAAASWGSSREPADVSEPAKRAKAEGDPGAAPKASETSLPAFLWRALEAVEDAGLAALRAGAASVVREAVSQAVQTESAGSKATAAGDAAHTAVLRRFSLEATRAAVRGISLAATRFIERCASLPVPHSGHESAQRRQRIARGVLTVTSAATSAANGALVRPSAAEALLVLPSPAAVALRVRCWLELGRARQGLAEATAVMSAQLQHSTDPDSDEIGALAIAAADAAAQSAMQGTESVPGLASRAELHAEMEDGEDDQPEAQTGEDDDSAMTIRAPASAQTAFASANAMVHAASAADVPKLVRELVMAPLCRYAVLNAAASHGSHAWSVWESLLDAATEAASALEDALALHLGVDTASLPLDGDLLLALPATGAASAAGAGAGGSMLAEPAHVRVAVAAASRCSLQRPELANQARAWLSRWLRTSADAQPGAVAAARQALSGPGLSVEAAEETAALCEVAGHADAAAAVWERCARDRKGDVAAWAGLVRQLRRLGRVMEAAEATRRGCRALGSESGALVALVED